MDFKEVENLLYTKHVQNSKNTLKHIRSILERLDNLHRNIGKIIHVTGTNGKGSVCAIVEKILRVKGYKTALFTSPHIRSLTERIKINGSNISEEDFLRIFKKVYPLCEDLTFFEIMTVIAFVYFSENNVDYSVIEVGIGGLYDTTNVVEDTVLSIITSIGIDHTNMLGNTLTDIARQKAGIIKEKSICVIPWDIEESAKAVIKEEAEKKNTELIEIANFFDIVNIDNKNFLIELKDKKTGFKFKFPLPGIKQPLNLSLAIEGLNRIGVFCDEKVFTSISDIKLEGRFQVIKKRVKDREITFILDGAHNTQAVLNFVKTVKLFSLPERNIIFSVLSTKDYVSMSEIIAKNFNDIIVTQIKHPKSVSAYNLADVISRFNPEVDITVDSDIAGALIYACSKSDIVFIIGSFYLVSDAINIIEREL